jgi:DNA replication protein DnaC
VCKQQYKNSQSTRKTTLKEDFAMQMGWYQREALEDALNVLDNWIMGTIEACGRNSNVMINGDPGTGKTIIYNIFALLVPTHRCGTIEEGKWPVEDVFMKMYAD